MILLDVVATAVSAPQWVNIVILGIAMGVVNTTVTKVGLQPVSLGFITGDLNSLAKEVAEGVEQRREEHGPARWQIPWKRAGLLAALWSAFLFGSLVAAILVGQSPVLALVLPALALLGFATLVHVE